MTENGSYQGEMMIKNNFVFENGMNGIIIHNSLQEEAKVILEQNHVIENGMTSRKEEGRETVGGIVFKDEGYQNNLYMQLLDKNVVFANGKDLTYQCIGTCPIWHQSTRNKACGDLSPKFIDSEYFNALEECEDHKEMNKDLLKAIPSCMKVCTQYTPLVEELGLDCEEPPKNDLCDVHYGHKHKVHASNKSMHEHQEKIWTEDL